MTHTWEFVGGYVTTKCSGRRLRYWCGICGAIGERHPATLEITIKDRPIDSVRCEDRFNRGGP
jgi:hypothetical protein